MAKREEGYNISDTGNWNVASDFSKLKIMKPLYLSDCYENVARFGHDSIIEQLENYNIPLDQLKLIGFERLVNELLKICGNVKFAMKSKGTQKELDNIKKKLEEIRRIIPVLSKTITKMKNKSLVLENEKYYKTLDIVIGLKSQLNEPLNKNHLIFTDKEEFDPKAYKKSILESAKTRG